MEQGAAAGDFGAFLSEFLTGDDALLQGYDPSGLLDPASLNAVSQLDPALAIPAVNDATRKRIAEQDSDSDDEGAGAQQGSGKRAKSSDGSIAARNKATREKARREKINERFGELASLIDPGKEPKTDKPTILADAIKHVHQMRVENHQLRQLNKFLEERVAHLERERGQALYQHSLMMQHGGMMMPPAVPPMSGMHMAPGPGMPGPSGLHAPSPQPGLIPHAAMAAAAAAAQAAATAALQQHSAAIAGGAAGGLGGMPGMQPYPPMPPPSAPMQSASSMDMPSTSGIKVPSPDGLSPGPMGHWVAPQMLDTTRDSLLRPPAA